MRTRAEIVEYLKETLTTHLGISHLHCSKVTEASDIYDDLGADDLDEIELVMILEEKFGIEISEEEMETFAIHRSTIGALADFLVKRVEEVHAAR